MACSLALAARNDLSLRKGVLSLGVHSVSLRVLSLISRRELEYSTSLDVTLGALYANATQTRRGRLDLDHQCVCALCASRLKI